MIMKNLNVQISFHDMRMLSYVHSRKLMIQDKKKEDQLCFRMQSAKRHGARDRLLT